MQVRILPQITSHNPEFMFPKAILRSQRNRSGRLNFVKVTTELMKAHSILHHYHLFDERI